MAKILLVEDDNILREIFEMRLQAEGYDTVTASDGEEALATAIQEKPDLIIADVMMPKMSGFEMLETLRSSPDMAQVKVVMMTALGQAEDRARGEKLGVIKYLVKSQVTLEDFVRTIKEVVGGTAENTDASATGPSNAINNNIGGDTTMDDNSQPTNPAPAGGGTPAGGDGGGANPVSGDGQMSSAQAQDNMNAQVNDAMGGGAPAAPMGGDAGAGAPAAPSGDMGGTPADVPMSSPPADQPADDHAGDDTQTPPAGGGGAPAAPGGM